MNRRLVPLLVLGALIPALAGAQTRHGRDSRVPVAQDHRGEVGVFGGYLWSGSLDVSYGPARGTLDLESGPNWGIVGEYNVAPGGQVQLLYNRMDSRVVVRRAGGLVEEEIDAALEYWHVGGLGGFQQGDVLPFVSVSFGGARFIPDSPGRDDVWKFSAIFSAGAKFYVSPRFALRAQGRIPFVFTSRRRSDRLWPGMLRVARRHRVRAGRRLGRTHGAVLMSRELRAARALFPCTRNQAFLNTATYGPGCEPVRAAVDRALDGWMKGENWQTWERAAEEARSLFAALLRVPPETVALLPTVSSAGGQVAASLPDPSSGRDEIVVGAGEFRSNLFPWIAQEARGFRVRVLPFAKGRPAWGRARRPDRRADRARGAVERAERLRSPPAPRARRPALPGLRRTPVPGRHAIRRRARAERGRRRLPRGVRLQVAARAEGNVVPVGRPRPARVRPARRTELEDPREPLRGLLRASLRAGGTRLQARPVALVVLLGGGGRWSEAGDGARRRRDRVPRARPRSTFPGGAAIGGASRRGDPGGGGLAHRVARGPRTGPHPAGARGAGRRRGGAQHVRPGVFCVLQTTRRTWTAHSPRWRAPRGRPSRRS